MRIQRKNKSPRKGAAVVEFAICAPVVFLIFIGMVEFGRIMMVQHVVTTSAREGARESILVGASQSSIDAVVAQSLAGAGIAADEFSMSMSPTLANAVTGDTITLTVQVPISSITVLGSIWLGDAYQLTSSSSMRKEGFD